MGCVQEGITLQLSVSDKCFRAFVLP